MVQPPSKQSFYFSSGLGNLRVSLSLPGQLWGDIQPTGLKMIQCSGQVMYAQPGSSWEATGAGDGFWYFTQDPELSPWPLPLPFEWVKKQLTRATNQSLWEIQTPSPPNSTPRLHPISLLWTLWIKSLPSGSSTFLLQTDIFSIIHFLFHSKHKSLPSKKLLWVLFLEGMILSNNFFMCQFPWQWVTRSPVGSAYQGLFYLPSASQSIQDGTKGHHSLQKQGSQILDPLLGNI